MSMLRDLRLKIGCAAIALAVGALTAGTNAQEELSMDIYFGRQPKDYKVAKWGPESVPSPAYAFTAAKILPVVGDPITNGVILTKDSKVIALGPRSEITIPDDYEVVDLGRHWIVPGLVDLHCHVAGGGSMTRFTPPILRCAPWIRSTFRTTGSRPRWPVESGACSSSPAPDPTWGGLEPSPRLLATHQRRP